MFDNEIDFALNRDNGQLWVTDRRWIWETVRELQPRVAVETGTWKGGGSTFFIASAMQKNGFGILNTVEANYDLHLEATRNYGIYGKWRHLHDYVHFYHGDSLAVYREALIDEEVDFVFLDGDGGSAASREFLLLAPKVRKGGVVMVHDWHNGKYVPELVDNRDWALEVKGDPKQFGDFYTGTVGIAKATKR